MGQVYLPYTEIAPGVREALDATGRDWTPAYVGGSDSDYWHLLDGLWTAGDTFCILEHDVLPLPDSFDELESCEGDWCAFPTPYLSGTYPGLGCVKFSADILRAVPDAMTRVGLRSNDTHGPRHYCTIDTFLRTVLMAEGFDQCVHERVLAHWRGYPGIPQPTHSCRNT